MKWTTERPTKPGYYWFRSVHCLPHVKDVVLVEEEHGKLWMSYEDRRFRYSVDAIDDSEWAGPIPEPTH